jgi:hypothetical protein
MLRLVKRPLAAFLGLWFLLVMIEPESIHSCPVHSASVGGAHAGHAGHHGARAGDHKSHDKSKAVCSCPGDCTASAFNALPSVKAEIAFASAIDAASQQPLAESVQLTHADFLLPFAIGPPAGIAA